MLFPCTCTYICWQLLSYQNIKGPYLEAKVVEEVAANKIVTCIHNFITYYVNDMTVCAFLCSDISRRVHPVLMTREV